MGSPLYSANAFVVPLCCTRCPGAYGFMIPKLVSGAPLGIATALSL